MINLRVYCADLDIRPSKEQRDEGLETPLSAMTVDKWCMTKWVPTPAEVETLLAGGELLVWCYGTQPMMQVEVQDFVDTYDINPYVRVKGEDEPVSF